MPKENKICKIINHLTAALEIGAITRERYDKIISDMTEQQIDGTIKDLADCIYVQGLAKKLYSDIDITPAETDYLKGHREKCFVCNAVAERIKEGYDK